MKKIYVHSNKIIEVGHGQRNAMGLAHELEQERILRDRFHPRRTQRVYCPRCRLMLDRYIVLCHRQFLHEHLVEHAIQRALGVEREWMQQHITQTGMWSQDKE